jgi:hypothetical protein
MDLVFYLLILAQLVLRESIKDSNSQQWVFDGEYIKSNFTGQVLDVYVSSFDNGAEVCIWMGNGGLNQKWKFDSFDGNNYLIGRKLVLEYDHLKEFRIKSKHSGYYLTIKNDVEFDESRLVVEKKSDKKSQIWKMSKEGFLLSSLNELTLEVQSKIIFKISLFGW